MRKLVADNSQNLKVWLDPHYGNVVKNGPFFLTMDDDHWIFLEVLFAGKLFPVHFVHRANFALEDENGVSLDTEAILENASILTTEKLNKY